VRETVVGPASVLALVIWGQVGSAFAGVEDAETGVLEDKIRQVEALVEAQQARIESLKRKADAARVPSTDAARMAEIRSVVRELMADADFREGLYPDIQQVGYDKGFYVKSADEAFLLKIGGYLQVLWVGQNRQTDDPRQPGRQKQDDVEGFDVKRACLAFGGHIHSPRLTYRIVVRGQPSTDHRWRTHDADITYAFADELKVTVGRFKLPFGRQKLVPRTVLQFAHRSAANEMFELDRSIAAVLHGTLAKRVSYAVAVANGIDNEEDSPSREELDTNFAYVARLVTHILGNRIRTESDLSYSKDPRLEAGVSFACNDDNGDDNMDAAHSIPDRIRSGRGIGGSAVADLAGTDFLQFGADAAFQYRGFSATAEYWVRSIDGEAEFSEWERMTGRQDATHQQGGHVQAGYFIVPKKVELVARVGGVWDNDGDDVWEIAVGANYFPWGTYNVLLQTDFTRMAEAPSSSSSAYLMQNDEVNMVRVQLLVKF